MVIDHLKKVIVAAEMLEVPVVGTFIGKDKDQTVPKTWKIMPKYGRPSSNSRKEPGIKIAIENCPMIFSYDEWPGGNNLAITQPSGAKCGRLFPMIILA